MKNVTVVSAVNSKEITHADLGTTFIVPNMLKLDMADNYGSFSEFT